VTWGTAKLGDLILINPRTTAPAGQICEFVDMAAIVPGRRYVRANTSRAWGGSGAKFVGGDTLMARITPCLENGKIAQFSSQSVVPAQGSTEFWVLRAKEGVSDPAFVFYLVSTDIVRGPAEKSMVGASGRQRADVEVLRSLEVPAPKLAEQRRIASFLSAYDDLIENNTRRIAILEEMARRIYEEWFVRFRFPGYENVRMVESELGAAPEGWQIASLTEVASVSYGKNLPKTKLADDGQFPVYGASKIIGRYTEFTRECRTLIVGCRGSVGIPQITLPRCFVTNNSFTIDPVHPRGLLWLFLALQHRGLADIVGGAAQPQITLEGMSGANLIAPCDDVIYLFDRVVRPIFELAWNLADKNRILHATRHLLLPKLISGELDVSKIPKPETAAA